MLDAWWLFAVVVGLYLHDCVLWHRRGQFVFFGRIGRCRAAHEPSLSVGATGGLSFLDPLPPLPTAFRAEGTSLSVASGRDALERWHAATMPLRFACNLLFIVFFGGAFLLCWFDAWAAWWPTWAAAGVPLWLGSTTLAAAATSEIFNISFVKALGRCAVLIASPMTAIRAVDRTSERLLIDQHPLVAAYLLCSEPEFARLVRRQWFTAADSDEVRGVLRRFLREVKREKLLTDVPDREIGAQSFCPACWAQYTTVDTECKDCGVAVVAFEGHEKHETHETIETHEKKTTITQEGQEIVSEDR
jgi:hypothetical protein